MEAVCRAPFTVGSAGPRQEPALHLEETGVADWVPTLILLGLLGFASAFLVLLCLSCFGFSVSLSSFAHFSQGLHSKQCECDNQNTDRTPDGGGKEEIQR